MIYHQAARLHRGRQPRHNPDFAKVLKKMCEFYPKVLKKMWRFYLKVLKKMWKFYQKVLKKM